jgi:NAD(P)-dependent dehydrogenase (short-subunit alcohol dehydrogenase family)
MDDQRTSAGNSPDRVVVIIGGTSGIGAAIAERFLDAGACVSVAGLDAQATPSRVSSRATVVELDVTRDHALDDLMASLPRLDVLVNTAGVIRRGAEFIPEVFSQVIEINLIGVMRACVAARPLLAQSHGCVVNMASMLSFFGGPLVPAYTASKGAIMQLTKSLAVAWAADGVRVNAVAPGWIRTDLTAGIRDDEAAERRILERTPMRRWGEPADVAGAVAFLAGPDAAFITGVVLPVDGGYLAN